MGKAEHWATSVTREGKKVFDKALPNSEDRLRDVYEWLGAHGRLLVVVSGTDATGVVLPHPARQITAMHAQRNNVAA